MKKLFYILPAIFLLAACQPESEVTEEEEKNPIEIQDESALNEDEKTIEESKVKDVAENSETELKSFETLDEIIAFSGSAEIDKFKTVKPEGFKAYEYGAFDGSLPPHNFAPDGVSASIYILVDILTKEAKEKYPDGYSVLKNYPFYIQLETPPPCFMVEEDCDDINVVKYFGPFEGPMMRMLE